MLARHIVILLAFLTSMGFAQKIFLDNVPEYTSLANCAITPMSSIVRNMANGCGDDKKTTSYSCFCSASSSHFSSLISKKVKAACSGDNSQIASAEEVFDSYCAIGTVSTGAVSIQANITGNSMASTVAPATANPGALATESFKALPTHPLASFPPPARKASDANRGLSFDMTALLACVWLLGSVIA